METNNENTNVVKQRHGCVTAWLILMIIANGIAALANIFTSNLIAENLPGNVPTSMIILLGVIGIGGVIFTVLLYQWKKIGFWGIIITSIAAFIINLSIGLNLGQSLLGLVGIAILYGILQIKKGSITAWAQLE